MNNYFYWPKTKCTELALLCNNKHEFLKNYPKAYRACLRNNWLDELTTHFVEKKQDPYRYWTKDKCSIEALKVKTRSDFYKNKCGAYKAAWRNNWLDEICQHMITQGDTHKRINYVYEFSDNHVYVGLTCNINRRKIEHLTSEKSSVYKHVNKTGLTPKITFDSLKNYLESQEKEKRLIDEYTRQGWILLNKVKGGGLGSQMTKWTNEKAHQEALKYSNRTDFKKNASTAYKFCLKNKIMDYVCSHMVKHKIIKPVRNRWTKEQCTAIALAYQTKKAFYTHSQNAYRFSAKYGFLNDICSHMGKR